ncbi:MAG: hypothetical protein K9M96_01795 [Deltaproteobacteria bacterium]|nr:hypothetical protein [Deltaproteobacteria bacterium]
MNDAIRAQVERFNSVEYDRPILISELEKLLDKSKDFRHSMEFYDRLVFIKQSRYLAPYNAFLAMQQRSDITFVLSAYKWESQYQRKPRDNVQPIVIMKPFGPVEFVYDIKDTEGEGLFDYFPNLPTEEVCRRLYPVDGWIPPLEHQYQIMVFNCRRLGLKFHEALLDPRHHGQAKFVSNRLRIPKKEVTKENRLTNYEIQVNRAYPVEGKLGALVHELAHIFSGHLEGSPETQQSKDDSELEFEAEAVSYLYCYRRDFKPKSEQYLSNYLKDGWNPPLVMFETILKALKGIEDLSKDPAEEKAFLPRKFEVGIGGYFGPSYGIELEGTTLIYTASSNMPDEVQETRITPSAKAWRSFWKTCNKIGIWAWRDNYEETGVCDGTGWSLHIEQEFRTLHCSGSNAFPDDDPYFEDFVDGYPRPFSRFLKAISRLIGGLPFE